ncbi:MAG: TolC family protein [Myxococcota bacterium]
MKSLLLITLLGAPMSPAEYVASLEGAPVLTLAEAERLAVEQNFDIRIARERLARSAILSKKAWSVVLPNINASYSFVRNNQEVTVDFLAGFGPVFDAVGLAQPPSDPTVIQNLWQQNGSLSFDWTILSGRSLPLILNAYDTVKQSEAEYEQQREVLTFTTGLAYYNALTAARTVEIRERALEIATRNAELSRAQAELGSANSVDALRAEVDVATAEQDLIQAQIQKLVTDRALAVLINRIDTEGQVVVFQLDRPPEPDVIVDGLLDSALDQRLDLQLREFDFAIAERSVDESYTKFLPELVLSGAYNVTNAAGFAGNNATWFVSIGLQWAIFEGGEIFWEVFERRHDAAAAAIAVEQRQVAIADDVVQSQLDLASAQSNYEAAQRRVELAEKSAELAQAQFELGAATQLEVLDANRSLADAAADEAIGQLNVDLARLRMQRVIKIDPDQTGAAGQVANTGPATSTGTAPAAPQPAAGNVANGNIAN